jgi:hypothetical protein
MTRRAIRLGVEVLEERSVPSGMTAAPVVALPAAVQAAHPLAGVGTGTYSGIFDMPDTGLNYHFSGAGHFGVFGNATVTGAIRGVGMLATGYAHGTLTFTNGSGSMTVEVNGLRAQPGFAFPPNWFTYHVVAATGSYQGLADHGTLRIDYQPAAVPMHIAAGQSSFQAAAGTFRIAI